MRFNWADPKTLTRVINEDRKYFPTLHPDPSEWIAPYRRDLIKRKGAGEGTMSLQGSLFDEGAFETGTHKCKFGKFTIHYSPETFNEALDEIIKNGRPVAIDIETNGLDPHVDHMRAVQMCDDGKTAHVLLTQEIGPSCQPVLARLLNECPVVLHNGVFDLAWLLVFTGVWPKRYCFDTLIAAQNLDAGYYEAHEKPFNLGSVCKRYLDIIVNKEKQKSFVGELKPLTLPQIEYAAIDVMVTWRLAAVLAKHIEDRFLKETFFDLDLPCTAVSVDIKVRGVPVSIPKLEGLRDAIAPKAEELGIEAAKLLGLENPEDIRSNVKVLEAFHKLGHPLESTGEPVIVSHFLGYPVRRVEKEDIEVVRNKCEGAAVLLEYRELQKSVDYMLTGFLTKYVNRERSCVNPSLNVCGQLSEKGAGKDVATGRSSSSSPNLQNINSSQEFRDIFEAPKGFVYLKTDAVAQELRVMAEVSGDETMRQIYQNEGDTFADIYSETAARVMNKPVSEVSKYERKTFKTIVLGVGFGSGDKTIAEGARISLEEAKEAKEGYFRTFPGVKTFITRSAQIAQKQGFLANSFSGRRRHWNPAKMKGFEYRYKTQSGNFRIQCLVPETMILTEEGYRPLIECDGKRVWDGDAWTLCRLHGGEEKPVVEVRSSDDRVIRCSPEHPFLMSSGKWKMAKELLAGDTVPPVLAPPAGGGTSYTPASQEIIDGLNVRGGPGGGKFSRLKGTTDGESLYWLMGYLIGDGNYNVLKRCYAVIRHCEEAIREKIVSIVDSLVDTGTQCNIKYYRERPSYYRYTVPVVISRLLVHHGLGRAIHFEKSIPKEVMTASVESRTSILRGLFDSDGGITGSSTTGFSVEYATVSEELGKQVSYLLTSVGVSNHCMRFKNGKNRDKFSIRVAKSAIEKFRDFVGFTDDRKNLLTDMAVQYRAFMADGPKANTTPDNVIKSVTFTDETAVMYDLEVFSENHKFVAEWAYVHNSGAADCTKKSLLLAYERLAPMGCRPCPPVHDEMVFLSPCEVANESLQILSDCMVEGSEFYLKTVPMKSEGALGRTWQKEAGYCAHCNTYPDTSKKQKGGDADDLDWYARKGFEDTRVVKIQDDWQILCGRCYIALLEKQRVQSPTPQIPPVTI